VAISRPEDIIKTDECGPDSSGSRMGLKLGSCAEGNAHSGTINCWGFLE
jgi:hypothetical protein